MEIGVLSIRKIREAVAKHTVILGRSDPETVVLYLDRHVARWHRCHLPD
jgi:hypothetical protein